MTTIRNSTRKNSGTKSRTAPSRRVNLPTRSARGNGNGHQTPRSGNGNSRPTASNGNGHKEPKPTQMETLSPREQLQREHDQVRAELDRLRAELLETPEHTGDEVDLSVYDREKTLGLVNAFERRLEKLEQALQASKQGQYGVCQTCGKPIDAERLKIFPETRHCIKCKIEQEQQAKRRMMQYK